MSIPSGKLVILVLVPVIALFGLLIYLSFQLRGQGVVQPVEYSHKVHIETAGMTCTDCHIYADKAASATIPNIDVCQTCHADEPVSKSPEELKVINHVKEEKEIPWRQIYKVPDHVYFSHRRHVVDGAVECSECHGAVAEAAGPVTYQIIPVTMENCLNCHKQREVTTDCLACHR